ncbi:MAG TPA: hypothetical protein VJO33_05085 [Gemmatimonadaceae bacterium]|nr:hypothetical protein [Gemmatimonadaceae bacterium]
MIRLVHTDELRTRIDNERADAAQKEWERANRQMLVAGVVVQRCATELRAIIDGPFAPKVEDLQNVVETLEGALDVLRGEWLASPKSMAERKR